MIENKVQLITYANRFGDGDIASLHDILSNELKGVFGGVHLLPFYYPIDGRDAGFDPIDHKQVDEQLGNWQDIRRLSEEVPVIADVIVNHISAESEQFIDYLKNGDQSTSAALILTYDKVFNGQSQEVEKIYRPRPGAPFTSFLLASGEEKKIWTTFTENQIDIDVHSPEGIKYLEGILDLFAEHGIKMIRLDAVGYAIKLPGTSCFMIDETYDFIKELTHKAKNRGMTVLAEIHAHHSKQIAIAKVTDYVYDFALPVLVFDTIFFKNATNLKNWLKISPSNAVTVLDTHDGIGIVDLAEAEGLPGLIANTQLDQIVEKIHHNNMQQSREATGSAASNVDLYQVNCTYFDALGRNEEHYLLARAIQFFVPGIPQVYYVGFLCGENNMELLAKTKVGRDINRSYFSQEEVLTAIESPIVEKLINLIRFRNEHLSFGSGFYVGNTANETLILGWKNKRGESKLIVNLIDLSFRITYSKQGSQYILNL